MNRITTGLIVLLLAGPPLQGADKPTGKSSTPREQYEALMAEWPEMLKEYQDAMKEAKTDQDRQKATEDKAPWIRIRPRLLALAEKYPKDPVALDALLFVVGKTDPDSVGKDALSSRALQILARDHIQSEKLTYVCLYRGYAPGKTIETFLRAVLEKNPHREVQGSACYTLTRLLKGRGGEADQEEEKLLERLATEYADLKEPVYQRPLGEFAKGELFEMRHLAIGKPVPEIEGEDIDGKAFKLSDYRGKVVLLDFWGHW